MLRDIFKAFDADGSGAIDRQVFVVLLSLFFYCFVSTVEGQIRGCSISLVVSDIDSIGQEFSTAIRALGLQKFMRELNVMWAEVDLCIILLLFILNVYYYFLSAHFCSAQVDLDGSGELDMDEFADLMSRTAI